MSSGNAHQDGLHEELDAAIHENAPSDKLEDVEIQRLVQLSNDASYQRSERVPVKTVEAFEPRSLVSIAMTAQRRRESELRTALAAGVVIDETATDPAEAGADPNGEAGEDAVAEHLNTEETGVLEASPDAAGGPTVDAEASQEGPRKMRRPPHRRLISKQVGLKVLRKAARLALTKAERQVWKKAGPPAAPKRQHSSSA